MMPFLDNLMNSLPVFLAHVGITLAMLIAGVLAYEAITPIASWPWCAPATRRRG